MSMGDVIAADRIFNLTTINDELIGSFDWVTDEAWTRRHASEEWSVAEIVGHVIEMERHWAHMAARIVEQPGAEVCRQLDDPERLSGPSGGMAFTPREARTRLAQAGEEAANILRKIPDAAWSTIGKCNGRDVTLSDLISNSLT